jgi:hypothetical protein
LERLLTIAIFAIASATEKRLIAIEIFDADIHPPIDLNSPTQIRDLASKFRNDAGFRMELGVKCFSLLLKAQHFAKTRYYSKENRY